MGKGSRPPPPPDPFKTASAEAQFNRVDTYGPNGAGVRYGYTGEDGRFVQGMAPEGSQSAVKNVEGRYERGMRQMMEPAASWLTQMMIGQNVLGLPNTPNAGPVGQFNLPGMTRGVGAPSTDMIGGVNMRDTTRRIRAPSTDMISQVGAPEAQNTQQIARDFYNRGFSLMRPAIEQQEGRLISNLQARGIPVGGEAFNDAYGAQQREVNDTLSRLAMDANLAAGDEQSRRYGIDMAGAQFNQGEQGRLYDYGQNTAQFRQSEQQRLQQAAQQAAQFRQGEQLRLYGIGQDQAQFRQNEGQRQFGNQGSLFNMALQNRASAGDEQNRQYNLQAADRGRALSELAALMGGGYQPPSAVPSGNVAGVNYGGMVQQGYQNQLGQWQQQQQNRMNTASTLGSLGSMLFKSSIHAKDMMGEMDTAMAAQIVHRMPLHVWRYKDGPDNRAHVGPTAQDFHSMTELGTEEHISVIDYLGILAGALQHSLRRIEMLELQIRYRTGGAHEDA